MSQGNDAKVILTFERTDDIERTFLRSDCYVNLNDESLSLNKIKETINRCYFIPTGCEYNLAVYAPFNQQLEKKTVLQGEPSAAELQQKLTPYLQKSDLYGETMENILHLHIYPGTFLVVPFIFTLNEKYPSEGNLDYPLLKVLQGFPLAYLQFYWSFPEVIAHFQQSIYWYIYQSIPVAGDAATLQLQCREYQLQLFNLEGLEHTSMNSIYQNDPIIVKIVGGSVPKLRLFFEQLQWPEEVPLIPFTRGVRAGRVESSDSGFLTPDEHSAVEERFRTPPPPPPTYYPLVGDLEEDLVEERDLSHLKPSAGEDLSLLPAPPSRLTRPPSLSTQELQESFQNFGVKISPAGLSKLVARSSTVTGAMDYYFENPDLFLETVEENDGKEEASPVPVTNPPSAPEMMSKEHSEESFEVVVAEDYEEISYLDGEGLPTAEVTVNHDKIDSTPFPPRPPSPPRIGLLQPTYCGTCSANAEEVYSDLKIARFAQRFRELGFQLNEVQIQELLLRASTFDGMINYYLSHLDLIHPLSPHNQQQSQKPSSSRSEGGGGRPASPQYEKQCLICYCDYPMEEMYGLNCCDNHYFCIGCLFRLLKFAIQGSEDTAPYIPACPLANRKPNGCGYVLTENECQQIISLAVDSKSVEDINYHQGQDLIRRMKKLYLVRAYYAANCVRCPSCPSELEDEAFWISLPPEGKKTAMRVDCPTCYASFCSCCMKFPFHYGCQCNEVMPYMRAWMEWMGRGRHDYLRELSKHEGRYQEMMKDFEKKRSEHEKKVKEAEDRFRELEASERELSRFCKACPHCGFRIEKIDGCDSMKCGQDYHGNSLGLGCGKGFSWSTAPPYQPNLADRKMPEELDAVPPEKAYEIRHEIEEGVPLPCDYCQSPIIGPKIQCLNCPCYTLCLNCSTNVSFEEVDPFGHHNSHTCKVIFEK